MSQASLPIWIEPLVAALLLLSAVFVLAAAWFIVRLRSFFDRMHPPALISVAATWCVTLASVIYFSALERTLKIEFWLIALLLGVAAPISTVLLARAALFRGRQQSQPDLPPGLHTHMRQDTTDGNKP